MNYLKQKLIQGKHVIGTWNLIPSSVCVDILASSGLDFIIFDSEHGPVSYETAQTLSMVCESRKVSPIMRVPSVCESSILKALDIGAHGIHIPNLKDIESIKKVVEFSKYPPLGSRGFSPFNRGGGYTSNNNQTLEERNSEHLNIIHIEGPEGIEMMDQALEIEGIDVFFIGVYDLSKNLGYPGDVNHKVVLEHTERLCEKIRAAGKIPGSIVNHHDQMKQYLNFGMQYLTYSADCEILLNAYKNIHQTFKDSLEL